MSDSHACRSASSPLTADRETAQTRCDEAREAPEPAVRQRLFQEAFAAAMRCDDAVLEMRVLSLMIIFQIGSGHARELIQRFWPSFRSLSHIVRQMTNPQEQHLALWSAERVLYYAIDFPQIPATALERAVTQWHDALFIVGGYSAEAILRLQLHHALRLNRMDTAATLFTALEKAEPESNLRPAASKLPGEDDEESGERSHDFGCRAYANQIRVAYHCARADAQAAWRAARHLVEGRSACDLSLCAVAPREAFAVLLEPLDKAGMREEADRCHALGLPLVKGRAVAIGWLGHHLRHLGRRSALRKARALLADARLLPRKATPYQRHLFLEGAVAIMKGSGPAHREEALTFGREADALENDFNLRNGGRPFEP